MALPQLSHGPCTASPSYGQERIVGRIYEGSIWFYRVERRLRRHTTPDGEKDAKSEVLSLALGALHPFLNKHSVRSSTDSSRQQSTISSSTSSTSQDVSNASSKATVQFYLVPPEDILEHVSAAELENFENNLVREEELEAGNLRRCALEKRQRAIDRQEKRAAAAKAQGLGIDMKHEDLLVEESESTPSGSASNHGTPVPTTEGGRMKRKAGEVAVDRLAATPWTMQKKRMTARLKDTPLATSSASSPKPRGRLKGSGMTKSKAIHHASMEPKASLKPTFEAKGKASMEQVSANIEPADPGMEYVEIIDLRTSAIEPYTREFKVLFGGSKNKTRWMAEHELPQALIDDYDREYDIEALISDCLVDGVRMFEVSWKGYPGENTVQSADTLPDEMVEEYLRLKYDVPREVQHEIENADATDDQDMDVDDEKPLDGFDENDSWTAKFIRGGL